MVFILLDVDVMKFTKIAKNIYAVILIKNPNKCMVSVLCSKIFHHSIVVEKFPNDSMLIDQ